MDVKQSNIQIMTISSFTRVVQVGVKNTIQDFAVAPVFDDVLQVFCYLGG